LLQIGGQAIGKLLINSGTDGFDTILRVRMRAEELRLPVTFCRFLENFHDFDHRCGIIARLRHKTHAQLVCFEFIAAAIFQINQLRHSHGDHGVGAGAIGVIGISRRDNGSTRETLHELLFCQVFSAMPADNVTNFMSKHPRKLPFCREARIESLSNEDLPPRQRKGIDHIRVSQQVKLKRVVAPGCITMLHHRITDPVNPGLPFGVAAFASVVVRHLGRCLQPQRHFLLFIHLNVLFLAGDSIVLRGAEVRDDGDYDDYQRNQDSGASASTATTIAPVRVVCTHVVCLSNEVLPELAIAIPIKTQDTPRYGARPCRFFCRRVLPVSTDGPVDLRTLPIEKLIERSQTLVEALPYIRKFRGTTVVIKYGGHAMVDPALKQMIIQDIALMTTVGMHPVVVHGGGPEITAHLKKLGVQSQFVDGQRVTDQETLDVAEMVLAGKINSEVVMDLTRAGVRAVGMSGKDMSLITARKLYHHTGEGQQPADIGFVGEVESVNPEVIRIFRENQIVPVISPIAVDAQGQTYNINADTAAAAIAGQLQADKFILLTDVKGVLRDRKDDGSLISSIHMDEVENLISSGVIEGGMIPKVRACLGALRQGARKTHILDGRQPHSLLLELFTDRGIGTQIIP